MSDLPEIRELSTRKLGRIYYILDYLKKAKIAEAVNQCVPNSDYSVYIEGVGFVYFTVGQIYEIMVINRLYGLKTPLYHIGEWSENTAIPEIYGIRASLLTDDRIGRILDKIYPYLAKIDSRITMNIIREYSIEVSQIHFDPSSFKVYGDYTPNAGEKPAINITYGRDGQGRKDDKLVRFGIAIARDSAFPMMGKAYSGNTSDPEMHPEFLTQLREILGTSDFLFIADSKLDTRNNIRDIMDNKGFFLCPGVFTPELKKAYLERYRKRNKFEQLEYLSQSEKKKPKNKRNNFYAFERMHKIVFKEHGKKKKGGKKRTYTYQHRLIFVYSPTKAKTEEKSRQKAMTKVKKELKYLADNLNTNRKGYQTHKEIMDKLAAIKNRPSCKKFFKVEIQEENGLLSLSYSIKQEQVDNCKLLDGIYTLKTNLPKKKYSINDVLTHYKKQSRIEDKIADIKGPLLVAPMYLKKPQRIVSLFNIIVQALKIYTLIERDVHQAVEQRGESIPILPENRLSQRPKASTILRIFDDHFVTLISITFQDGSCKTCLSPLSDKQKMLFSFIKRRPPDRRTFSRKIGVYKIMAQSHKCSS